jgi:putative ATP-binding cassette transporter
VRLVRERLDTVYKLFRDLLDGMKELQLNRSRGEHFVSEVIGPEARAYRQVFIRGFSAYIWIANVGDVVFYAVIGMLLFVVPDALHLPMSSELRVRIGLTLLYLIGPISAISNSIPVISQASIALGKILKLDVDLDLDRDAPAALPAADPFGESAPGATQLQLADVVYEYTLQGVGPHFLLGPLSFGIAQGQITFIVGANGSGKSTLAKILSGLYTPESGHVFLNGVAVTPGNVDHYRRRFSAVFSDFHLFEHLMGVGGASGTDIARVYLKKLKIDHKVSLEDGRFSTVELSSGQKKRLALIISYLEDRPIYLFDEWAADQDPVFKNFFYTELLPELKARGKTVIAISHDDAYFHRADRVVRIDPEVSGPAPTPDPLELLPC